MTIHVELYHRGEYYEVMRTKVFKTAWALFTRRRKQGRKVQLRITK